MLRPALSCLLGLLGALIGAPPAQADFVDALKDYRAGRYESARAEFAALAELGDSASQHNLGAMTLNGEGGPKDAGTAVGWLMAASNNGDQRLTPGKLEELKKQLTPEQRQAADEIFKRYRRAGLEQTVLPDPQPRCHKRTPPKVATSVRHGSDLYPENGRQHWQNGFVIIQLTIGVDGVPRDPQVLMSEPSAEFSAAAIDVWMPSRWEPAAEDGLPVESRMSVKVAFSLGGGGVLWNLPALKKIREAAQSGNPTAQYLIGLAATLDPSLAIKRDEANKLLLLAAQGGYPQAQYWIANRFINSAECVPESKKMVWLRAAARAGDGAAELTLAQTLLEHEPTAEQIAEARSLLIQAAPSEDLYVMTHVAALLGASPLEAVRDPGTAKAVADRLKELRNAPEKDPQMYEAAAAAYAAHGDFRLASSQEERAIRKAAGLGWNTQPMEERLALYRKSQPWVGDLFAAVPPPAKAP